MTIMPTSEEWQEWWAEAAKNSQQNSSEPFESYCQVPRHLGKGYVQEIEVYPNLLLGISDSEYHDDLLMKIPESTNHPLQFCVWLLGSDTDDTLISGAGFQRSWTWEAPKSQRIVEWLLS